MSDKLARAEARIAQLEKWRMDVTSALRRPGGTHYEDVPALVAELLRERDAFKDQLLGSADQLVKWRQEHEELRAKMVAWLERSDEIQAMVDAHADMEEQHAEVIDQQAERIAQLEAKLASDGGLSGP